MKRRTFLQVCGAAPVFRAQGNGVEETVPLEEGFRRPPASARPFTWWHWMNGNITADGITRDLEAMAKVGVGGFQIFQVGTGIPKGPVEYGSAQHLRLLEHAAREAERLGLAFEMHNCPGWSSSGGPWNPPELAMQQMVWSETFVRGGRRVEVVLPQPITRLGFYRDAFVLAFPSLRGEAGELPELVSRITSSSGPVDTRLLQGGLQDGLELRPVVAGQPAWLQIEFREPFEARSLTLWSGGLGPGAGFRPGLPAARPALEVSDDGTTFRKVAELNWPAGMRAGEAPCGCNFPAVRARFFRVLCPQPRRVTALRLSGAARLVDWPTKANFVGAPETFPGLPEASPADAIDPARVLDLTAHMDSQGKLTWEAPPGGWTILRIGYTPVGTQNHPAPDGGLGLECDKYSRAAMDHHFQQFFGKLEPALRPLAARGLVGALIDSYEVGFQNWTPGFPEEFRRRCGYDLRRYLPAMTGRIVGSVEISERFLWDVRRAQADLMADNYYGRFAELCRERGWKSYTEPYDGGPFDEMQIGSRVDVPMGEFWIARGNHRSVKLAASVAHVHGKRIVGAEAFTGAPQFSKWQEHPYSMKPLGDWMFAQGINRYIFHRYAHQPHPTAVPGMTMGPWGFHFDRTNTWWEQGRAWLEYVMRCQYMLQQGVFVGDILYFEGETAPLAAPSRSQLDPPPPPGYDWDTLDREALLRQVRIEQGRIVVPGGSAYRILVLRNKPVMTLEVARRLLELVRQGMWLVGARPQRCASLKDYPACDAEFQRVVGEIWGDLDGKARKEHSLGKGRVVWGESLEAVLAKLGVPPDFRWSARSPDAEINYIHRRAGDVDIYFVANRRRRSEDLVCTFRVQGKEPELWDPSTGEIIPAAIHETSGGRVSVPLRLAPAGSVFVVFRRQARSQGWRKLLRNGATVLGVEPFRQPPTGKQADVANSFTVCAWIKPEVEVPLPIGPGPGFLRGATSFVVYPPEGVRRHGQGHACAGLMAGRNGVVVYERDSGTPRPVLTVPAPLSGWTHVALVYRDGAPSLYLNGSLARQGQRSQFTVHAVVGEAPGDLEVPYFEGEMCEPQVFSEALGDQRIAQLAAAGPPEPEGPPPVEPVRSAKPALLLWREGRYQLRSGDGRVIGFEIAGLGEPVTVPGPWRVSFPPGLGAPPEITLPELVSLHRHPDPAVRYFSGTATYYNRFRVDGAGQGRRLYLDLGRVEVIAEVRLNGRNLGILWKPPFRVDITQAARPGDNELQVLVTNLWINRLIGDEHLPPEGEYGEGGAGTMAAGAIRRLPEWYLQGKPKPPGGRITFTTWKHHSKDSPLVESGLIGPVRLRWAAVREL